MRSTIIKFIWSFINLMNNTRIFNTVWLQSISSGACHNSHKHSNSSHNNNPYNPRTNNPNHYKIINLLGGQRC